MAVFKIRAALERDYTRGYDARERRYRRHVRAAAPGMPRDLRTFFGYDFFHDGTVDRFKFDAVQRIAKMHVNCPNIEQMGADGSRRFVNRWFTCTFRVVV